MQGLQAHHSLSNKGAAHQVCTSLRAQVAAMGRAVSCIMFT